MPVVGSLFADRTKALLALEAATPAEGNARFLRGLHAPIPPREVAAGECQEVVLTGDQVDLFALPLPVYSGKDGGAYVTVALEISRDPEDGSANASVYRVMRLDRNHLAVMSHAFQGLGTHIARAARLGRPLDVAIVNGCDPVLLYAAQAKVPHGFDELTIAGGINGAPVEVVDRAGAERIIVENGKAAGVILKTHARRAPERFVFRAPIVISNADSLHTYRDLVGEEHSGRWMIDYLESLRPTYPCFLIHIGLRGYDQSLLEKAEGYYWSTYDPDDAIKNVFKVFTTTRFDPSVAPPDCQVLITQKLTPMRLEEITDPAAHKAAVEAQVFARLRELLPDFEKIGRAHV